MSAELHDITETLWSGGYDATEGELGSRDQTWTDFGIVCGIADRYERALRLIRDGRCECGGRFKNTSTQMRCEQCGTHQGYGYGHAVGIAKKALNE